MIEFLQNNLSWLISSIISIVGFFVTYTLMQKSFKNEITKTKNKMAIDKLQNAAYILFNNHSLQISPEQKKQNFYRHTMI